MWASFGSMVRRAKAISSSCEPVSWGTETRRLPWSSSAAHGCHAGIQDRGQALNRDGLSGGQLAEENHVTETAVRDFMGWNFSGRLVSLTKVFHSRSLTGEARKSVSS